MNSMTASTPPPAPRRALTRADYDRFQPLVRRLAMRAARRVPSHIKAQDLMGYGWLGLVEAFSRAEATMADEEFEAYASYRIRGAMLDYLRSLDPMARALRSRSRHVSRAIADLTKSLGRQPEEEEIAKALGMDLDAYRETLSDIGKAGMARLELPWTRSTWSPRRKRGRRSEPSGHGGAGRRRHRQAPRAPSPAPGALLPGRMHAARDRPRARGHRVARLAAPHRGHSPPSGSAAEGVRSWVTASTSR